MGWGWGGGGGGGGATLKKSKNVQVDYGNFWVGIDFFRPTILTNFSGFQLDYTIIFMNLSNGTIALPPNSFYNDFALIL